MNDRFKFRVWDTKDLQYIEDLDIVRLTQNGKFVFTNAMNNTEPELNPKRFVFEQCTGLKDKNGNLIYENDVVEYDDEYCIVFFSTPTLQWGLMKSNCSVYGDKIKRLDIYQIDCEIIGNIHENGDLLR